MNYDISLRYKDDPLRVFKTYLQGVNLETLRKVFEDEDVVYFYMKQFKQFMIFQPIMKYIQTMVYFKELLNEKQIDINKFLGYCAKNTPDIPIETLNGFINLQPDIITIESRLNLQCF